MQGLSSIKVGLFLTAGFSSVCSLPAAADYFAQGSKNISVSAATGRSFGDDYFVLGVGAGYFVIRGLEVGADARFWLGGDSDIYEITPHATYVFSDLGKFKPYIGVMYRQTFIEDYDDQAAIGGRAGVYLEYGQNVFMQAGVLAYEYQDCNETIFRDCSEVMPEVSLGFSF